MAKRKFELPGIQDLSKEQEAARAFPKEGRHLIVGGPGTGKSVLALIRARRHSRDDDDYLFLVFNHLLDRASGQLFGDGLNSRTWDKWFREMFRETAKETVPRHPPDHRGYRAIDWDGVNEIVHALPEVGADFPYLVIDEGQDMPSEFYASLVNLGFARFFVVADQNQQITEANSNRQDIQNNLDIDTEDVIELRANYRNRYPVARLAREFYTGDPASPPPDLPPESRGAVPQLFSYRPEDIEKVATRILRFADRDPRQLIGVIAPSNTVRERYFDALRTSDAKLDNGMPSVNTYYMGERAAVAFDEGGILVINAQACKGLEFDSVVLADIDEHYHRRDDRDIAKRLFYVMVARARERVFMFQKQNGSNRIEEILPSDSNVLQREVFR
ncbi:MAG: ATP-binding domain-containing protein [Gammaproteobacteria bacterium]|nr:ATP-binding domain-containing protein [Gammaproteobacteria bacterium]